MFESFGFQASNIINLCRDENSFNNAGKPGEKLDIISASNLMNIYFYGANYN